LELVKCRGAFQDYCEDLTGALKYAIEYLNWTGQNYFKTLVIVTDSPAHGKKYHN
jgi:hypothetical protein